MPDQINWTAVGVFWAVFMSLAQFGTAFVVLLLKKQATNFQGQAATSEAIQTVQRHLKAALDAQTEEIRNEMEREVNQLKTGDHQMERRVIVLEQTVAHAPKARDLEALRHEITNLSHTVARFEGRQEESNRVLRLLHEFLMEKSR